MSFLTIMEENIQLHAQNHQLRVEIDSLRAALEAALPQGEVVAWQSMTTCPRDGSVVWLRWGNDHVSPGWWSAPVSPIQNEDGTWPAETDGFPWAFFDRESRETIVNHAVDTAYGPTHWAIYTRPQPAPQSEPLSDAMAEALTVGDGTMEVALQYWHQRALAAEALAATGKQSGSERERFEAWARGKDHGLVRTEHGVYCFNRTRDLWEAWQAATASRETVSKQVVEDFEQLNGVRETGGVDLSEFRKLAEKWEDAMTQASCVSPGSVRYCARQLRALIDQQRDSGAGGEAVITRLFNNAHVLFQKTNDNGFNEVAIAASVDSGDMIVLEQEGRHIVIDPASVPELCRLLKQLQKEGAND